MKALAFVAVAPRAKSTKIPCISKNVQNHLFPYACLILLKTLCSANFVACPKGSTFLDPPGLCLGLSVPGDPLEAAESCPPATPINSAEQFWMENDEIWSSLRRPYHDGPFLKWLAGDDMGDPAVVRWNASALAEKESLCASYNPRDSLHTPHPCNGMGKIKLPAVCAFPPSAPNPNVLCDEDLRSSTSTSPGNNICLIVKRTGGVSWDAAAGLCESTSPNCKLVQRGYIHVPGLRSVAKGLIPLGMKGNDGRLIWATGPMDNEDVARAEFNFEEYEDHYADAFVVAVNGTTGEWVRTLNSHAFEFVVCETFQEPKAYSIDLQLDDDKIDIVVTPKDDTAIVKCFSDANTVYPAGITIARRSLGEFETFPVGDGYYWCYVVLPDAPYPKASARVLVSSEGNFNTLSVLFETRLNSYGDYLAKGQNIFPLEVKREIENVCLRLFGGGNNSPGITCSLKRIYNVGTFLIHVKDAEEAYIGSIENNDMLEILRIRGTRRCLEDEEFRMVGAVSGSRIVVRRSCIEIEVACIGDFVEGYAWTVIHRHDVCNNLQRSSIGGALGGPEIIERNDPETMMQNSREEAILKLLNEPSVNMSTLNSATRMISGLMESKATVSAKILKSFETFASKVDMEGATHITIEASNVALLIARTNVRSPVLSVEFVENRNAVGSLRPFSGIDTTDVTAIASIPREAIRNEPKIAFAVFKTVNGFQKSDLDTINSRIISVSAGNMSLLPKSQLLELSFKPLNVLSNNTMKVCSFWSLKSDEWSDDGCHLTIHDKFDVCRCNHMTHFAEIIRRVSVAGHDANQYILDVISLLSSVLSIFGLVGIYFTGFMFKKWRLEPGHKLLLHFSTAIGIQQLAFFTIAVKLSRGNSIVCICTGILLHYAILAEFLWMFVSACLQFLRLVAVFADRQSFFILRKAMYLSWGIPLIPVITILSIDVNLYSDLNGTREFCYPVGLAFYLGVMAPVAFITLANLIIYAGILHGLWCSSGSHMQRHCGSEKRLFARKLAVTIFLLFLLGLTWISGLLSEITFFAYLFCITAPLQGFVIFLFFIVLESKTRMLWLRVFGLRNGSQVPAGTGISKISSSNKQTEDDSVSTLRAPHEIMQKIN